LKAGQGWSIRLPIGLAIAIPAMPLVAVESVMQANAGVFALIAVTELALGMLGGALFFPLFAVPRAVGALIDLQAGLQSVQLFDPTSAERSSTLFADLFEQAALFVFVMAGGIAMLSELFMLSHQLWPVGASEFPTLERVLEVGAKGFDAMMSAVLIYIAPFAIVLTLLDYGMGLIGRAAPQLNVLTTSVSLKITATLILIIVMGNPLSREIERNAAALTDGATTLFRDMGGLKP